MPEDIHIEIARTQRQFMGIYEQQRAYLAGKPDQYLTDLLHASEETLASKAFSERTAAEINRAACTMLLEERGK